MTHHGLIFPCNFLNMQRFLGAYRIASFLRENNWDVEVIDFMKFFTLDELKEITKSRVNLETKFIGFSTLYNVWNDTLEDFISWIKLTYPDILIIVGGQYCEVLNLNADYYVGGYGENSILAILNYHFTNSNEELKLDPKWLSQSKNVVQNVYYPSAPMKSLLVKYEDRDFIEPNEWLFMEFSRGCIFKCDFCNVPMMGVKGDWTRDAEDFELQMRDTYERFGVKNYYTTDETFNDSTEKLQKYAEVVKRLDFDPIFSGCLRADLLISRLSDRELLGEMGFISHFYGIETFNHPSGKSIGKGMHPDRLKEGLLDLQSYYKKQGPYRGHISMIIGLPQETEETIAQSVDWIFNNWQGESMSFLPLEISDKTRKNTVENHISALSRNPEKYGYRKSNLEIPPDNFYIKKHHIRLKFAQTIYNWHSDGLSYVRACELADNIFRESLQKDFRLGTYNLHNPGITDINEILEYPQRMENTWKIELDAVEKYKEKKINYKE